MELKNINIVSVFKFFGGISFIVGLIVGLFGNLLRIDIVSADIIRVFPFMARIGPGIFTGIVFAILGIIGDATDLTLGLDSTSWFLLAIIAFVACIGPFVELGIAWYLKTTSSK